MDLNDIYLAQKRLQPYLLPTPLIFSSLLEKKIKKQVWLKLETQQPTGSFKPRPAFNNILTHLTLAQKNGVVASSSGNFAQGVAYAARELNVSAQIVMMEKTSPYKIERTKKLGAEVILCSNSNEDRVALTEHIHQKTGRLILHPYDSEETIAGDGTLGLELSAELPNQLNASMTIFVPVSGGGLLAGIAYALKHLHPHCKIVGVQPQSNGSLPASLKAGHCVDVGEVTTIADALVATSPGVTPFAIIQQYVDEIILVDEASIQSATDFLIQQHKLVVEPGGAVALAGLLSEQVTTEDSICIISGGNIDLCKVS